MSAGADAASRSVARAHCAGRAAEGLSDLLVRFIQEVAQHDRGLLLRRKLCQQPGDLLARDNSGAGVGRIRAIQQGQVCGWDGTPALGLAPV